MSSGSHVSDELIEAENEIEDARWKIAHMARRYAKADWMPGKRRAKQKLDAAMAELEAAIIRREELLRPPQTAEPGRQGGGPA